MFTGVSEIAKNGAYQKEELEFYAVKEEFPMHIKKVKYGKFHPMQ